MSHSEALVTTTGARIWSLPLQAACVQLWHGGAPSNQQGLNTRLQLDEGPACTSLSEAVTELWKWEREKTMFVRTSLKESILCD